MDRGRLRPLDRRELEALDRRVLSSRYRNTQGSAQRETWVLRQRETQALDNWRFRSPTLDPGEGWLLVEEGVTKEKGGNTLRPLCSCIWALRGKKW